MPSNTLRSAHRVLSWSTLCLTIVSTVVIGTAVYGPVGRDASARLVRQPKKELPWVVLDAAKIASGATVNASTHTVIHLPETFVKITRETLLGHEGKRTRYWGYCFPENYDPTIVDKRQGFPGLIFLSEKEREVRKAAEDAKKRALSPTYIPTSEADINDYLSRSTPTIRHQIDVFKPGSLCYVMSESELAIGIDPDDDLLNDEVERHINTDPSVPDTDGDGILDGVEYMTGTNPTVRDTDEDGIIDGLEDKNWNGKVDRGETDPRQWDSDRDGLCDGYCRVKVANKQYIYMGEDENLNGIMDGNESSPLKYDTDGDEYSDHIEYLMCLADGGSSCTGLSIDE